MALPSPYGQLAFSPIIKFAAFEALSPASNARFRERRLAGEQPRSAGRSRMRAGVRPSHLASGRTDKGEAGAITERRERAPPSGAASVELHQRIRPPLPSFGQRCTQCVCVCIDIATYKHINLGTITISMYVSLSAHCCVMRNDACSGD